MGTVPTGPGGVSPFAAAQEALEHTRRQLFPFRFERWLALGFVAFLDQCGRGGGGTGAFRAPAPPPLAGTEAEISRGLEWLATHALLVGLVTAAATGAIVVLVALVLWINSRGVFMYADDVATGRADVARPWREHAPAAGSYFLWTLGLALATLGTLVAVAVAAAAVVAGSIRAGGGAAALGAVTLVGLVGLVLLVVVAAALAFLALRDFAAPLQMITGRPCGEALQTLAAVVREYPGTFAVYVLLKLVFHMAVGVVMVAAACLTCCCALLPVVSQTLLQPAFYFERAWSLFLLRQLGYDVIRAAPPSVATS